MAFKFPSSNWQEPKGFERVLSEDRCCVCQSTHDLGYSPEHLYTVCKQHANMQPVAIHIVAQRVADGTRISKAVFDAGRWNSWDREAMLPHFSDELLVEHTSHVINNSSRIRYPASTYDEAIQLYAAELVKRLQSLRFIDDKWINEQTSPCVTEIVIQPINAGETCIGDVVLSDQSIERYEIWRVL